MLPPEKRTQVQITKQSRLRAEGVQPKQAMSILVQVLLTFLALSACLGDVVTPWKHRLRTNMLKESIRLLDQLQQMEVGLVGILPIDGRDNLTRLGGNDAESEEDDEHGVHRAPGAWQVDGCVSVCARVRTDPCCLEPDCSSPLCLGKGFL